MPTLSVATIPQELKDRPQWVNWKIELREDKETKVPYQPNGLHAMSNAPRTWSGVETCMRAFEFRHEDVTVEPSDKDSVTGRYVRSREVMKKLLGR